MNTRTRLVLVLLTTLALVGCDDSPADTDAGTTPDAARIDGGMMTVDAGPGVDGGPGSDAGAACNIENFAVTFELAEIETSMNYFVYSGDDSDTDPINTIYLEMYTDLVAFAPMTWTFTGENYQDCELCLTIEANCTAGVCAQRFLARSGTLTITAAEGVQDGAFVASARNLVFDEVTIDPTSRMSTVVAGGDVWCIDPFDIDTTVDDVTD